MKRKATFGDLKSKDLLSKTEEKTNLESKVDAIQKQVETSNINQETRQVGRPKKPLKEKEDKPITLKFTQKQYDKIVEDAGGVPLASFLKKKLTDNNLI